MTQITEAELQKIGFVETAPLIYKCKRVSLLYGNYGEEKGEQQGARFIIPITFNGIETSQAYSKELHFIEEIKDIYFALHGEKL